MQYDTMKYFSKGAFAFGLISVYDVFIDGKSFSDYASMDAATYALSVVVSELSVDVLSGLWTMNEGSIQGMLSRPLLSGIVYMYLFNYFIRPNYEGSNDNTTNFVIGALMEVVLSYIANPLSAIFGYKSY